MASLSWYSLSGASFSTSEDIIFIWSSVAARISSGLNPLRMARSPPSGMGFTEQLQPGWMGSKSSV